MGQIGVAGLLLIGVIMSGYGYFEQNSTYLYIGIAVILAEVLNGLVRILVGRK